MSGRPTAGSGSDTKIRAQITAERQEMIEILSDLPPDRWDTGSLCAGWRVREVVAHMTMPFRYTGVRFAAELLRSGGRFHRMADRCARRDAAAPAAELLSALRDNATNPWTPPGGGPEGALIHDVIHGLDVTVPLGVDRPVAPQRLRLVLQGITRPRTLAHFGADLAGVALQADDMNWSFGAGTPMSGAAADLALVICGRALPAGRLHGGPSARFTRP